MSDEDPRGLLARWAGEGRALIDAARARASAIISAAMSPVCAPLALS